jgi:xanthine dehydrogenase accessory factor
VRRHDEHNEHGERMTTWSDTLWARLQCESAVLVTVVRVQGSVPRDSGTAMAVFAHDELGTIGGGHLEFQAIHLARKILQGVPAPDEPQRNALGPSLGQCCGGVVHLSYEPVGSQDVLRLRAQLALRRKPIITLFGGGHVGRSLIRILETLPFEIHWLDSRDAIFPAELPSHVQCEQSEPVQAAVHDLPSGSCVLIMSFSHAEDLDVLAACLKRAQAQEDLPYIGLIGSATKWASFKSRLQAQGFSEADLSRVTCPIGIESIVGKEPEVIAVAVAAQLLQQLKM